MKKQRMMRYNTSYIQCPTGVYKLVGTMPAYLGQMLFKSEETAREAQAEAIQVLTAQKPPASSKFVRAYASASFII